jgi:HK97 gp10 family phage protein
MPPRYVQIRLEGQAQFRRQLRLLSDGTEDLKEAHTDAAKLVENEARPNVPVRSGALQGSLRSSGTKTRGVVRVGFARVPYAGVVHFGWPARNIAPQPFIYDALDHRRADVIDVYHDRVNEISRRAGLDVRKL